MIKKKSRGEYRILIMYKVYLLNINLIWILGYFKLEFLILIYYFCFGFIIVVVLIMEEIWECMSKFDFWLRDVNFIKLEGFVLVSVFVFLFICDGKV